MSRVTQRNNGPLQDLHRDNNDNLAFYSKIATWPYGDMEHAHEFILCHVYWQELE